MIYEKSTELKNAKRKPEEVTELILSIESFEKHDKINHVEVSDLIEDLSEFKNLEKLILYNFPIKDKLLNTIWNKKKLKILELFNVELKELPDEINTLPALEELRLRLNPIKTLPSSIGGLKNLITLDLCFCEKIETIPDELCKITSLNNLIFEDNYKLEYVPSNILTDMKNLNKDALKDVKKILNKIAKKKEKKGNVK